MQSYGILEILSESISRFDDPMTLRVCLCSVGFILEKINLLVPQKGKPFIQHFEDLEVPLKLEILQLHADSHCSSEATECVDYYYNTIRSFQNLSNTKVG